MTQTTMALAFISSFLHLESVAAGRHHPVIFGQNVTSFGRSMHKRGSTSTILPLVRIRNAPVEDATFTVREVRPNSSVEIATFDANKVDDDEIPTTILIEQGMSIITSSFMSFDIVTSIEEGMSMVSTFCMSMPDSSMIDPASSVDDTVDVTSDDYFGETIFQYLGQCAELELDINSCIVSTYIANFMNKYAATDDNDNGSSRSSRLRFLQLVFDNDNNSSTSSIGTLRRYHQQETTTTSNNNNHDECNRPEITETELRIDMTVANNQCSSTGDSISLLEYEYVITTFLQLFTNVDCWVSLCDGRSNGYFFKSLIANAAHCANVVLVNDCVYDSMLDLVLGQGRRLAVSSSSQSSSTCNDNLPSEAEVTTSIEYLLLKSKTYCLSVGVNYSSEVWDMVSSDLVTIFTSSECWDWQIEPCEEQDITSFSSSEMSATFITEKKTVSFSFIMAISISLILIAYYYYRFRRQLTTSDVLLGQEFVLDDSSSKGKMKKNINNNGGNDEESSSLQYTTFDDEESLAYSTTSVES